MDSYQSKALESWYKEGHELRLDPLHPLLGLAGECGELLNLYKKDKFKPDFDWWNCKQCNQRKEFTYHDLNEKDSHPYIPLILDELGDAWYYLRILAWQNKVEFSDLFNKYKREWFIDSSILECLIDLSVISAKMLEIFYIDKEISYPGISECTYTLLILLEHLDCSIAQLTELNYQKLNTPSQNGWHNAR